jgi:hypothetical protein
MSQCLQSSLQFSGIHCKQYTQLLHLHVPPSSTIKSRTKPQNHTQVVPRQGLEWKQLKGGLSQRSRHQVELWHHLTVLMMATPQQQQQQQLGQTAASVESEAPTAQHGCRQHCIIIIIISISIIIISSSTLCRVCARL